jgi:hypothetical protein
LGINITNEHSIEFHPGSVTWTTEGIFQLAALAMAFIQASLKPDGSDVTKLPRSVSGLKQFIDNMKVVKSMGSHGKFISHLVKRHMPTRPKPTTVTPVEASGGREQSGCGR